MKLRSFFVPVVFLWIFGMTINQASASGYKDNWPSWRGPLSTGEAVKGNPPTVWSETKNVKWKTPIPGKGLSSPIIWDDQIFITTAIPLDTKASAEDIEKMKAAQNAYTRTNNNLPDCLQQFVVYSFDRKTGNTIWRKVVRKQFPHEGTHEDSSWATQSCVTDGEHLIASFGSFGIYCFDLEGSMVWEKDLGDMSIFNNYGEASSPVLYENYLVIIWDHEKDSYVFVLDKTNGELIWKKSRDEKTSWATPIVVPVKGKPQLIVAGGPKSNSIAYDLENGDVIWEISGIKGQIVASPIADGEMAWMKSDRGETKAINLEKAKGDLKDSAAVVWAYDKTGPAIPSHLLYNGRLYYLCGYDGRLNCVEAKTGNRYYESQKLDGMKKVYASPVAANGFVYVVGRNGMCHVVKDGVEFTVVSQNKLDDGFDASPAIVGNALYLRGLKSLYCISE